MAWSVSGDVFGKGSGYDTSDRGWQADITLSSHVPKIEEHEFYKHCQFQGLIHLAKLGTVVFLKLVQSGAGCSKMQEMVQIWNSQHWQD